MDDCDSDTGTTNGATGGPLTRSRSKGRLHEPSLNSCRRVQDALGVRLFVLPLYFRIYFYFRMGDSTDVVFCVQEAPFAVAFKDAGMGWAESFISFGGGFIYLRTLNSR